MRMGSGTGESFGAVLRRFRGARGLTQEELAERAGLHVQAISKLEREVHRTPRWTTVELLAGALSLAGSERRTFETAARDLRAPALEPGQLMESASEPLTSLIGRAAELARALRFLAQDGTRLLTLAGPPGVGKTRIAQAVAAATRDRFRHGAVFVSLAPLSDPDLVGFAIRQALGLRTQGREPLVELLASHLRARHLLLVLDNFEHVLPAAPLLTDLLGACPDLHVLVTSRATLRIRGEQVLPVPPLAVPASGRTEAGSSWRVPSVALFVERARARQPDLILTAADWPPVAELCRRLDGLPLAIELAAGWIGVLDPPALVGRLAQRLPMLEKGLRDAPRRQQTMRDALQWSYDLLDPDEQAIFRQLSVFAGGASLEAITAVCPETSALPPGPMDLIERLVDNNLIVHDASRGEFRVTMLQVTREYARELLRSAGQVETMARAHFEHFARLVRVAEPELHGADQAACLDRLELEHDNIRAALQFAKTEGTFGSGLDMAARLWRFWDAHGHAHEGRMWLDSLLESASGLEPDLRARALMAAGHMALRSGAYGEAVARYEESRRLYDELGDRTGRASVLNGLATIALRQGEIGRGVTLFEESLAISRETGDQGRVATMLDNLALAVKQQRQYDRAIALHAESLGIRRSIDDGLGITMTLNNLSEIAFLQSRYDQAEEWLAESIALCRQLGAVRWLSFALGLAGRIACVRGDTAGAVVKLRESLDLAGEIMDPLNIADTLESLAMLSCREGQMKRGALMLGAADGVRDGMGIPQPVTSQAVRAPIVVAIRSAIGEDDFRAQLAVGHSMSPEQALDMLNK
jgi:predicted ATPase/DNA-binding XRE family transcriptional regulator